MIKLGVNIDHVATIRQARQTIEPDPIYAAFIAEQNGADQITVHLREDRRHMQDRDVRLLRETIQTRLNLEMAPTDEMVSIAKALHPDSVTLVPENRQEITTEGGLNVDLPGLGKKIMELSAAGIFVSLFIDPDDVVIKKSAKLKADAVELHTGDFSNAQPGDEQQAQIERIRVAAKIAKRQNLYVAAGHGITYHNVSLITPIAEIEEYNIGHTIIAHAVFNGLGNAVREMKALLQHHA